MGVTAVIDERKYGKLLAKTVPRVIRTDQEFERMVGWRASRFPSAR